MSGTEQKPSALRGIPPDEITDIRRAAEAMYDQLRLINGCLNTDHATVDSIRADVQTLMLRVHRVVMPHCWCHGGAESAAQQTDGLDAELRKLNWPARQTTMVSTLDRMSADSEAANRAFDLSTGDDDEADS